MSAFLSKLVGFIINFDKSNMSYHEIELYNSILSCEEIVNLLNYEYDTADSITYTSMTFSKQLCNFMDKYRKPDLLLYNEINIFCAVDLLIDEYLNRIEKEKVENNWKLLYDTIDSCCDDEIERNINIFTKEEISKLIDYEIEQKYGRLIEKAYLDENDKIVKILFNLGFRINYDYIYNTQQI